MVQPAIFSLVAFVPHWAAVHRGTPCVTHSGPTPTSFRAYPLPPTGSRMRPNRCGSRLGPLVRAGTDPLPRDAQIAFLARWLRRCRLALVRNSAARPGCVRRRRWRWVRRGGWRPVGRGSATGTAAARRGSDPFDQVRREASSMRRPRSSSSSRMTVAPHTWLRVRPVSGRSTPALARRSMAS